MKEKGIPFKAPMVRAILNGRKTQTRRIIDPQPTTSLVQGVECPEFWSAGKFRLKCPYGQRGDLLWVKETYTLTQHGKPVYRADSRDADGFLWGSVAADPKGVKWKPSIFMPRRLSRIALEITGLLVDRLQYISNADCWEEGMCDDTNPESKASRKWFSELWESINGPGSWDANPWVWVIEFRRVNP